MTDVYKRQVEVVATHYIDGSVRPQKIVLATGPVFEIEDSREAVQGKARTTGELARRYVVKIRGKETYLYEASGRWFVEMKARGRRPGCPGLFSVGRICKALGTAHLRSTCRRGIVTDKKLFMEGVREHGENVLCH